MRASALCVCVYTYAWLVCFVLFVSLLVCLIVCLACCLFVRSFDCLFVSLLPKVAPKASTNTQKDEEKPRQSATSRGSNAEGTATLTSPPKPLTSKLPELLEQWPENGCPGTGRQLQLQFRPESSSPGLKRFGKPAKTSKSQDAHVRTCLRTCIHAHIQYLPTYLPTYLPMLCFFSRADYSGHPWSTHS